MHVYGFILIITQSKMFNNYTCVLRQLSHPFHIFGIYACIMSSSKLLKSQPGNMCVEAVEAVEPSISYIWYIYACIMSSSKLLKSQPGKFVCTCTILLTLRQIDIVGTQDFAQLAQISGAKN